jgi:hypothetical protein
MPTMLDTVKKWISQIVEVGLLLIALGIVIEIIFGSNQAFFVGNIVNNLTSLIGNLGDDGLVGLIALAIILWLFMKKAPEA